MIKKTIANLMILSLLLLSACSNSNVTAEDIRNLHQSQIAASNEAIEQQKAREEYEKAQEEAQEAAAEIENSKRAEEEARKIEEAKEAAKASYLEVTFLDVGQGDSTLIACDDHYMLIDAGVYEAGEVVTSYLERHGINSLDIVVATHPDADHIGGLGQVLKALDIGIVFQSPQGGKTPTYEYFTNVIAEQGLTATSPAVNSSYALGSATITVLGPLYTYEELNNDSIVLRLDYQGVSFLFLADAEIEEETDIVNAGLDIDIDVLKVGHHGSKNSTSPYIISATTPTYAVISCGENNDYGHPHEETLISLRQANVETYRTDEDGTIICSVDSEGSITWNVPPSTTWLSGSESAQNASTSQEPSTQEE